MAAELRARGVACEEIVVASDPQLRLKYGRDVPVLVTAQFTCRHRLTPEAIAKLR